MVADEKTGSLDGGASAGMYVPIEQSPTNRVSLVVRANLDPSSLQRALRPAVQEVNKDQPLSDVLTLEQIKDESTASDRLRTMLLGVFAVLALMLAAIGIYGVISYAVVQRTHEIGIRAALGASAGTLVRLILRNGMALAAGGLALGFAGSLMLARVLESLLFGVTARDPATVSSAAAMLAAAAFLACYVPARRASKLDPLAALRHE